MEEILASIRRIISEDGAGEGEAAAAPAAEAPAEAPKPAAKPAAPAAPEPKPEPRAEAPPPPPPPQPAAPQEDVLELTDVVEDDGSIVNLKPPVPEPPPEPEGAPEPLFDEQRKRNRPAPPPTSQPRSLEGLVSPPVREEAIGHFSELADALHSPETPIGAGYKTVEEVTKEVMPPMLTEWLDPQPTKAGFALEVVHDRPKRADAR